MVFTLLENECLCNSAAASYSDKLVNTPQQKVNKNTKAQHYKYKAQTCVYLHTISCKHIYVYIIHIGEKYILHPK